MNDIASKETGKILIQIARASLCNAFGKPCNTPNENYPWLHAYGACFVTITLDQKLRGCIGTLEAYRPLLEDVKANTYAAAFRDPRFIPLTEDELALISIEISLLFPLQSISFSDESDALAQLRPNVDGVVFQYHQYRSTFLPQVWETLPNAQDFMAHLKQKAGLNPKYWNNEIKLYRYTVRKWKENDFTKEVEAPK